MNPTEEHWQNPDDFEDDAMPKTPPDIQAIVAQSVEQRGYWRLWTVDNLLARHVCKLIEEASEAAECIYLPLPLKLAVKLVGWLARVYFDDSKFWLPSAGSPEWRQRRARYEHALPSLQKELADCQVVLFSAAEAISKAQPVSAKPRFRIAYEALKKSRLDVSRGVRKE